jgi:hypothetical protein
MRLCIYDSRNIIEKTKVNIRKKLSLISDSHKSQWLKCPGITNPNHTIHKYVRYNSM